MEGGRGEEGGEQTMILYETGKFIELSMAKRNIT